MPERHGYRCVTCKQYLTGWMLVGCPICGSTVCHKCATVAYGRTFCTRQCAEYFFHGDPEEEVEEEG